MLPKLIISRPASSAEQFARDVQDALGRAVTCIFSPAYDIKFFPVEIEREPDAYVFTSANGVAAAARAGLSGKAWCVGDRTAQLANKAGFEAASARGDVEDLFELLVRQHPGGPLLHVASKHTRGDLGARLTAKGIPCDTLTAYDQVLLQPSRDLVAAVQGADPLVIPLFSPRAVLILNFNEVQAPMHVVAMSPSVGQAATDMNADTVVVAKSPTYHDMVDSTCHVMTQLFDRIG